MTSVHDLLSTSQQAQTQAQAQAMTSESATTSASHLLQQQGQQQLSPSPVPQPQQQHCQHPSGPPQPISRWGFEYNGTLTWKGIVRRDAAYLRSLCFPDQEADPVSRKRAQEEAAKTLTIKFMTAQLNHYGIIFPPGIKRDDLLQWLRNAILKGQCDKVPQYLEDRITGMVADFEPHRAAYEAWEREKAHQSMRDHFLSLPTLVQQANFDGSMLVSTYFTDEAGNPAPQKFRTVMSLQPVVRPWEVIGAVEKVPGLCFTSSQVKDDKSLFIGWDRGTVWQTREAYDAEATRKRKEARKARGRDRMARHKEYIDTVERTQVRQDFSIIGSYVIFCDAIEEQWDGPHNMTLDIGPSKTPGVFEAVFKFSVLAGIMILAPDHRQLEAHRNILEDDVRRYGNVYSETDGEVKEDVPSSFAPQGWPVGMPLPQGQQQTGLGAVQEAQTPLTNFKRGPAGQGGTAKKAKMSYSNNVQRRFVLQWRGRETGEGEVQADYENEHDGHIEFEDGRFGKFTGVMNMVFVGGDRAFQGYKVSDVPRKLGGQWGDFV